MFSYQASPRPQRGQRDGRPHDRLLRLGAPAEDADVQKAADRRAEERREDDDEDRTAGIGQINRHADLVQKDARGDRDVERLDAGARAEWRPAAVPPLSIAAPTPAPSLPDAPAPQGHGPPRAPASGRAARRRRPRPRSPLPAVRAQARNACGAASTAGSRKSAPMLPRTHLGVRQLGGARERDEPAAPARARCAAWCRRFPDPARASSTSVTEPGVGGEIVEASTPAAR